MTLSQLLRVILLLAVATTVHASAGNSTDSIDSNSTRYLEEAATVDFHIAMLNAVNKERSSRGLPKLCTHRDLQKAAQVHSADMARRNYLSHTGSDGSTATSRVRASGYRYTTVAENVAAGQSTVSKVMSSWMSSSGHRANLLSTKYKMFGCGYAYSSSSKYKHYWTQNFASGSGEVCG
ncbi:Uncharacterized protein P3T76_000699 [Phytophthora citrophthora]|uniref:SCP domain-containing protein n=1 Tax=Phytophthora citrophthora TaxID=4793 RepID=A0AAD9LSK8_9STRA|nr:Uncharacterized protein P3T76_000699 [Phytophthora citrophthora]